MEALILRLFPRGAYPASLSLHEDVPVELNFLPFFCIPVLPIYRLKTIRIEKNAGAFGQQSGL
jgi:hypothetical protein